MESKTFTRPYCMGYTVPVKTTNVLCSDGKYRTAWYTTLEPDTFFTHPARVSVKGKWVGGFVTYDDGVYKFHQYLKGKNSHLLPEQS